MLKLDHGSAIGSNRLTEALLKLYRILKVRIFCLKFSTQKEVLGFRFRVLSFLF